MKLVRENINEKFTEKSDPIKDMGIGIAFDKLAEDFMKDLSNNMGSEFMYREYVGKRPFSYNVQNYSIRLDTDPLSNSGVRMLIIALRVTMRKYKDILEVVQHPSNNRDLILKLKS